MKYRATLFDLGSTLIEYENHTWDELGKMGIISAYPYLKSKFPNLPEVEKFGPVFYRYLRDILDSRRNHSEVELYDTCMKIFRRMELNIDNGIVENFVNIYYKPVTEQVSMIPGADKILEKLKKADLIIGLVSNTIFPERFHLKEMERFNLLKYFDFTIFSSTVGVRKPGKQIFNLALEKAGVSASESIFIGDRFDADIAGAANAGIVSVWKYREGRENPDEVEPDFSIRDLGELEIIVLK